MDKMEWVPKMWYKVSQEVSNMNSPGPADRLEFTCPECQGKVIYERKTVLGAFRKRKTEAARTNGVSIYLSCENGHVRRYEIPR